MPPGFEKLTMAQQRRIMSAKKPQEAPNDHIRTPYKKPIKKPQQSEVVWKDGQSEAMRQCIVRGCPSQITKMMLQGGLKFFPFEFRGEKGKLWKEATLMRTVPNSHSIICSRHFISKKPAKSNAKSYRNSVDYVPTIFPFVNPTKKEKKKKKELKEKEKMEKKIRLKLEQKKKREQKIKLKKREEREKTNIQGKKILASTTPNSNPIVPTIVKKILASTTPNSKPIVPTIVKGNFCCVEDCGSSQGQGQGQGVRFFEFPDNIDKIQGDLWRRLLHLKDVLPTARVCGQHFVSGYPSQKRYEVDYLPTIFPKPYHDSGQVDTPTRTLNHRPKVEIIREYENNPPPPTINKSKMPLGDQCCVKSCYSREGVENINFYNFPVRSNGDKTIAWMEAINRYVLKALTQQFVLRSRNLSRRSNISINHSI
jgi:hypothetical protein